LPEKPVKASDSIGGADRRASALKAKSGRANGALKPGKIEISLVDPRPWTREALARTLETACRDFTVLRFSDAASLEQAEIPTTTALVLVNLTGMELNDPAACTTIATIRSYSLGLPVVALSDSANIENIFFAIEQGLSGYIPISLELRLVIEALRFVAAGGTFAPAESLLAIFDASAPPDHQPTAFLSEAATVAAAADLTAVASAIDSLTPRERAVLDWLRQGKSNKEVALKLRLCEATVKVHVRHIMRKLGASNRTQVALIAEELMR
jgi:DNA-binding NarL/FixJ family response regulator